MTTADELLNDLKADEENDGIFNEIGVSAVGEDTSLTESNAIEEGGVGSLENDVFSGNPEEDVFDFNLDNSGFNSDVFNKTSEVEELAFQRENSELNLDNMLENLNMDMGIHGVVDSSENVLDSALDEENILDEFHFDESPESNFPDEFSNSDINAGGDYSLTVGGGVPLDEESINSSMNEEDHFRNNDIYQEKEIEEEMPSFISEWKDSPHGLDDDEINDLEIQDSISLRATADQMAENSGAEKMEIAPENVVDSDGMNEYYQANDSLPREDEGFVSEADLNTDSFSADGEGLYTEADLTTDSVQEERGEFETAGDLSSTTASFDDNFQDTEVAGREFIADSDSKAEDIEANDSEGRANFENDIHDNELDNSEPFVEEDFSDKVNEENGVDFLAASEEATQEEENERGMNQLISEMNAGNEFAVEDSEILPDVQTDVSDDLIVSGVDSGWDTEENFPELKTGIYNDVVESQPATEENLFAHEGHWQNSEEPHAPEDIEQNSEMPLNQEGAYADNVSGTEALNWETPQTETSFTQSLVSSNVGYAKWFSGSENDKYFEINKQSVSEEISGYSGCDAIHINSGYDTYGWLVCFDNGIIMSLPDVREYQLRNGNLPATSGLIKYGTNEFKFNDIERIVIYQSIEYFSYGV